MSYTRVFTINYVVCVKYEWLCDSLGGDFLRQWRRQGVNLEVFAYDKCLDIYGEKNSVRNAQTCSKRLFIEPLKQ